MKQPRADTEPDRVRKEFLQRASLIGAVENKTCQREANTLDMLQV